MLLESKIILQKLFATQRNFCFCKNKNWRQQPVNTTKAASSTTTTTITKTTTTTIYPTTVCTTRCIYNGRKHVQHTSCTSTTAMTTTSFRSIISVSGNKNEDDVKNGNNNSSNIATTIQIDTKNHIDISSNDNNNNNNNNNDNDNGNNINNNNIQNKKILLLYDDYIKEQIENNIMQYDPIQIRTAKALQRLQKVLVNGYTNELFHYVEQQQKMKNNVIETKQQQQQLQQQLSNNNSNNRQPIRMGIYDLSIGAPPPPLPSSKVISNLTNDYKNKYSNDDSSDSTANETIQLLPRIPRGLYIYGSVGSGKSMLMDIFYDVVQVQSTTSTSTSRKVRYHFHELMSILHQSIHTIKNNDNNYTNTNNNNTTTTNSIQQVGIEFSKQYTIICIDELQIIDIGDAILLYQFFTVVLQYGTIIVCTSNRHPTKLYEYGMNYTYFINTLIPLLQHHCIVLDMISTIDYRLLNTNSSSSNTNNSTTTIDNNDYDNNNRTIVRQSLPESTTSFYMYLNTFPSFFFSSSLGSIISDKNITMNELIQQLRLQQSAGTEGVSIQQSIISIPSGYNRTVTIQNGDTNNFIAYCTFDELCGNGISSNNDDTVSTTCSLLSSIDYRAIAKHFSIVCIDNIPILSIGIGSSTTNHNKARRFITLIDELYEARVALICCTSTSTTIETKVTSPNDLFIDTFTIDNNYDDNHTTIHNTTIVNKNDDNISIKDHDNTKNNNTIPMEEMNLMSISELASVRELSFAIKRCTSRIIEMTSHNWWYNKAKTKNFGNN